MAMGHVILKEFYFDKRSAYFDDYARRYTDLPLLVVLNEKPCPTAQVMVPGPLCARQRFPDQLGQTNNPDWKTVAYRLDGKPGPAHRVDRFSAGVSDRPDLGQWNLESKDARTANEDTAELSVIEDGAQEHDVADVAFPYFGGVATPNFTANEQLGGDIMLRRVPVSRLALDGDGSG